MLDAVKLSLPHCSLSLWKHFISMSLVHVAPGAVHSYTLCNILSPRPFDAPFPFFRPHLYLPFILRTPFPSCHRYAFHTRPTSCRLNCSPPNTASGIGITLLTCTQVANSVHKAQFPSHKFPTHLVVGSLCTPRGRVVLVYLTMYLEALCFPL